jgi:hypothetical protein
MRPPATAIEFALSVRQPWAWAIVHGSKDVENRSKAAIDKGNMKPGRIAIHASQGMTRDEYEHAAAFMTRIGVNCPRPDELVRGGIIGAVTVTQFVRNHASPWFFGPQGLVLADKEAFEPVPCLGALGFFRWKSSGQLLSPAKWMTAWPICGRSSAPPAANPLLVAAPSGPAYTISLPFSETSS